MTDSPCNRRCFGRFVFFNWTFRSRLGRTWKNTVLNKTAFTPYTHYLPWPKGIYTYAIDAGIKAGKTYVHIHTRTHDQRRRCTGVRIINNMLISIMRFYACRDGSSETLYLFFGFFFRLPPITPPQVYITLDIISTLRYHYTRYNGENKSKNILSVLSR